MKAKRIFLYALTLVCALIMFSSCGNKNNLSPTTIYYSRASGSISASHVGTGSTSIIGSTYSTGSFQDAINAAIGDYTNTPQDSKVIAACDAIDAKIKADPNTKYSGTVTITRKQSNDDNGTVIKEYKYVK